MVKWFAYLVNEPSLGLYYIQMHFRESLTLMVENKVKIFILFSIRIYIFLQTIIFENSTQIKESNTKINQKIGKYQDFYSWNAKGIR